jgi:large subunit ribosomal protein L35
LFLPLGWDNCPINPVAQRFNLRYTDLVRLAAGIPLCERTLDRQNARPDKSDGINPVWNEKKMPKLKTHKGAAKRFKKTGTGKIVRNQTKTRHILTSKSPKVKRKLGKSVLVSDGDYAKVARMIPYA